MTKFWGSRFDAKSDNLADRFSFSISYDYRLAKHDVLSSIAHARMLGTCNIIPSKDARTIIQGLKAILDQIEKGTFTFDPKAEDIHSNILDLLKQKIGKAADRLHTARSRNDLIVTDMKLYCREQIEIISEQLTGLQQAIVGLARAHSDVIIPAYTHLQAAQVVLLAHHLLAYVEMLERDKDRLGDCRKRLNTLPLGSCALSGTTLPTSRTQVADDLGFDSVARNSIDAVSDRDFIIETLSCLAILGTHTSRIAEDLILWATSEFNFIDIDGSLCTGSSIMPHKKNPDILELIRGEAAGLDANLQQILVLLKGMPLTYNRDFQLDKPPLFASVETVNDILGLLTKLFKTLKIKSAVLTKRIEDELFFTVDIMEYLIRKDVTYREAHDTVGVMVKECLDHGKTLHNLSLAELQKYSPHFQEDVRELLNAGTSVKMKQSDGSTSPPSVKKQLRFWDKKLTGKKN